MSKQRKGKNKKEKRERRTREFEVGTKDLREVVGFLLVGLQLLLEPGQFVRMVGVKPLTELGGRRVHHRLLSSLRLHRLLLQKAHHKGLLAPQDASAHASSERI